MFIALTSHYVRASTERHPAYFAPLELKTWEYRAGITYDLQLIWLSFPRS